MSPNQVQAGRKAGEGQVLLGLGQGFAAEDLAAQVQDFDAEGWFGALEVDDSPGGLGKQAKVGVWARSCPQTEDL